MNSRLKYVIATLSACLAILLLVGSVMGRGQSAPQDAYRHLAVYTEVLSRIKSDYVEEPNMKSVTLGAVNGLLESIDPYASYLNADQYQQWLKTKDQHKGDVGLLVSRRYGYIGVEDAIPGSPAARAGLSTGDILETIAGVSTRDMPLAYAELLFKGAPGTTVDLTVLRVRRPEPQKITLTRAAVNLPPVSSRMLADQVGYVQVPALDAARVKEAAAAAADLQKQGAKKLVLDLRFSGAGTPQDGIALANLFLDKGLITYLQGQRVDRKDFQADPAKTVCRLPLAVIANRGTANGAEIAAAALLDNQRAEVIGERTYGDAAERKRITLDDGGAILLSVAKYYSPKSGKAIQDHGVTPSVPVQEAEPAGEPEDETAPERPESERKTGDDLLLKKALETLAKK